MESTLRPDGLSVCLHQISLSIFFILQLETAIMMLAVGCIPYLKRASKVVCACKTFCRELQLEVEEKVVFPISPATFSDLLLIALTISNETPINFHFGANFQTALCVSHA